MYCVLFQLFTKAYFNRLRLDVRQVFYNVNTGSDLFTNVTGDKILKIVKDIFLRFIVCNLIFVMYI